MRVQSLLSLLVLSDTLHVGIEQVARVQWTALGFRVELSGENGAVLVDHAFVGRVVEVDEVLLEVGGDSGSINGVAVVLGRDVTLSGGEIKSGNVVSAVSVLHLGSASANGDGKKLVTEADAHDGDLRGVHQGTKVVAGGTAVCWVTRSVRDEDTVKVARNLVDRVIEREASDGSSTANERTNDVLLDTAIDEGHVHVAQGRGNVEGCLCADLCDQVDVGRVIECFVLVGIVFLSDDNLAERRALLTKVRDNCTSVYAADGWDTLTGTPVAQTLDGGPVTVLKSCIGNDNARGLDVWRLEVLEQTKLIPDRRGYAVVSNQRLSENEDLTAV